MDALYVVEEASEYLNESVRALGIEVASYPAPLPRDGELTPGPGVLSRAAAARRRAHAGASCA
ncbi:hypothetical protein, partial [Eggerthella sinensis]|uniref:hypothetical protein n=1 Tax=Eggerthella sinensis TaxID=242230 RepID=UPI0022E8E92F